MVQSFFDRGPATRTGGPPTAVDMETAATATAHPGAATAAVEETFFGEKEAKRREAEKPPDPAQESANQDTKNLIAAIQSQGQTVAGLQQAVQQMAASANPNAQMQAMAQFEQARAQQNNMLQQMQPPSVEDPDELVSDGEAAKDFIERSRNWALQSARAEYAPVMQQMQMITTLAEPLLNDARDRAWHKTTEQLAERGYQPEQMGELRQLTEAIATRSYQDWQEQQKFLMNPDAMRFSAEAAFEALGNQMPARGEVPPVNAPRTRGGAQETSPKENSYMKQVGERLGIDISPETHQQMTDFQKANH